jgi:hypothetical protein
MWKQVVAHLHRAFVHHDIDADRISVPVVLRFGNECCGHLDVLRHGVSGGLAVSNHVESLLAVGLADHP